MKEEQYFASRVEAVPLRILVVDDNIDVASTMAELLQHLGHDVTVVHHPADALTKLQDCAFDFFLLDIGLPDMSGYELVENLVRQTAGKRVTFAAHTGYGSPADKKRAASAGFHHHFVKPAEPDLLQDALDDARVYRRFGLRRAEIGSMFSSRS